MTAPVLAQPAHPTSTVRIARISAQARTFKQAFKALKPGAAAATTIPCGDDPQPSGDEFYRCTGSSETATFVGSSCAEGEYNAGKGSYYNFWAFVNNCSTRVWLHEYPYPTDTTSGWSICTPGGYEGYANPPANPEPENIMVSANTAYCTPIYP
jgi:hypothetical protein